MSFQYVKFAHKQSRYNKYLLTKKYLKNTSEKVSINL